MKKKVVVWFNHWFSTAYHIIHLLKQDDDVDFYVIGTNDNTNSVVKEACDQWYLEPKGLNEQDYIAYCLDFCKKNQIEVFVPRRNQIFICKYLQEFQKIGVKVLTEADFEKVSVLQDKKKTYELFETLQIGHVPDHRIVNTLEGFERAYKELKKEDNRVCIKFVRDEGAMSFRVIDDSMQGYSGLFKQPGLKITYSSALDALCERETFADLMVMPYLSGVEVSVDCLKTEQGNIIIPRFKPSGRMEEIRFDQSIIEICERFFEQYGIECPCNIQFKYQDEIPYFLEINTRMSGGLHYSCLASNVNIPNLAVNQLLGINKKWNLDKAEKKVSFIETPMLL